MGKRIGLKRRQQRRATVVVQVAMSMTVVLGFGALSVDLGALMVARTEMQRTADSAALAAAAAMLDAKAAGVPADELAYEQADEYARANPVLGTSAGLDSASDMEYGNAVWNEATQRFEFEPGSPAAFDAVRVTIRRTAGSEGGAIPLVFAKIFGHNSTDMTARAAALLVPRDIMVVIDISNSMNYDSQLRYWNRTDGGYTNLRDIWAALDGPEPDRPYLPGAPTETQYAGDTGPTYGTMQDWGSYLFPDSYQASTDPGLTRIPKNTNLNDADIYQDLVNRGYSADEVNCLLSGKNAGGKNDDGDYNYRVCVILGLATWHSGRSGGLYADGDGDAYVDRGECAFVPYPSYRGGWRWYDFPNYQRSSSRGDFRYRYGMKTFTNWLLDQQAPYNKTNVLWATPQQPLRAVKDAVLAMINVLDAEAPLDHLGLTVFATNARAEVQLTENRLLTDSKLVARQTSHYGDGNTNIGQGMAFAQSELTSARARGAAKKVMVVMSDGYANYDETGNYNPTGARQFVLDQAEAAADDGIQVYTVSVGYNVDRDLMTQVAQIGHGQEFYAAGNPEDYTEMLEDIFRRLGGKRPVALIE